MFLPDSIQQRFHARVTARALADTLAQIPPQRTISPSTLLAANIAPTLVHEMTAAGLLGDVEPTATTNLPRIPLADRMAPRPSSRASTSTVDFEVVGLLGEGGMGRVLHVRQHSLARDVAIKTLKEGDASNPVSRCLLQEGRITGSLEHPGIVPVHALGLDEGGCPLIVMKRIEGVSLRVLLDDSTHSGWKSLGNDLANHIEVAIEILIRVCHSLSFAHHRGIVHRDIKPENIMIGEYGEVYLCDWGVATRLDDAASTIDMLVGTPAYMAPEMLLGGLVDARTDVYLLGATLHEVLTGRMRHDGATMHEILHSIAASAPYVYDASIAPELANLCNRATSSDPAQRPASADAFRKELAQYLHQRSATVLCEAALERVNALEALLTATQTESIPPDLPAAYRHATEARFGFTQSLRIHPLLEAAKQGRERALAALFDLELRQRHVETAAAVLEEMTHPAPEFAQRLDVVRKELDAHRLEGERLRAIARDLDPAVAARSRMLVLLTMTLFSLPLIIVILVRTPDAGITPASTVLFAGIVSLIALGVVVIFRRRLGETLFNRRMVAFLCTSLLLLLAHRVIAWRSGESTVQILMYDTFQYMAVSVLGAVTFERRLFALAAICMGTFAMMLVQPEKTVWYFQYMTLLLTPALIWVWKAPGSPSRARDAAEIR